MSSAPVFDAIVVGTGQAGPSLAARLSAAGWRVAVVEENRFGGTCVNNGCTPTKAMIASAYAARTAARAVDYGVVLDTGPRVDMKMQTSLGDVEMRADNHQVLQPLFVSTLARGVKYDSEDSGLGWKTDAKVDAKATALPTTCKMERPK